MAQGSKKTTGKQEVDPYKAGVAERIATAFKRHNANARRGNELSQVDLAKMIAKRLGLPKPPTQAAVSRWMSVTNPSVPEPPRLEAIAELLGADKTWLLWGDENDPSPEPDLTAEESEEAPRHSRASTPGDTPAPRPNTTRPAPAARSSRRPPGRTR